MGTVFFNNIYILALNFERLPFCLILLNLYIKNRYAHLLPDNEFPLLKMQEPTRVNGKYYFAQTRLKIGASDKKCMMCGKLLPTGPVISSHDPKRNTVSQNI